jgi:alanine racemase
LGVVKIRFPKNGQKTAKKSGRKPLFLLVQNDVGRCGDNGLVKSWVEISETRLVENLRAVQAIANVDPPQRAGNARREPRFGAGAEVLGVIKANAYGHNAAIVARVLVDAGVRWLGVADVEEGVWVRGVVGDGAHVLVMCGLEVDDCKEVVAYGLTPVVWTVEHVAMLERAAEAAGKVVRVHLEIDTGMARQGVDLEGVAEVAERLAESKWVRCEGVMSHLASAEVVGSEATERQRERFAEALQVIVGKGIKPEMVHLGNSSAVDEGSTLEWLRELAEGVSARVMVRPGIALYGYCLPIDTGLLGPRLHPVLTWKTRVIVVREIGVGDEVGYGGTFKAKSLMRLALLPVGYADGFRRAASSGVGDGWVMVAGQRAKVVGRVSMNLITVDVTDIAGVAVGDEVVLLGDGVTADDHARWSGTISYEILCGIRAGSARVSCGF